MTSSQGVECAFASATTKLCSVYYFSKPFFRFWVPSIMEMRLTPDQKIAGSTPAVLELLFASFCPNEQLFVWMED